MICQRCTKNVSPEGIHTCTPTDGWRALEARIAELELDLTAMKAEWSKAYDIGVRALHNLSALRKRIDEAPVVAWKYQWDKGQDIWPHKLQGDELFDFIPSPHTVHPLISKEDLQK